MTGIQLARTGRLSSYNWWMIHDWTSTQRNGQWLEACITEQKVWFKDVEETANAQEPFRHSS